MNLTPREESSSGLSKKLRLGLSSCLHGEEVRYDGGHRMDELLLGTIGRVVEWMLVCPEVEMGLGVPRPTLRLEGTHDAPRLIQTDSRRDITEGMREWARARLRRLAADDLDGFVFKKNSPSCGFFGVKLFDESGVPTGTSRGIFADELARALPLLPIEEEGRLQDPLVRENFIERVFGYHRLKKLMTPDAGPADLVAFHTAHKLTLMAHHPDRQRELGRLVAEAGTRSFDELFREYSRLFMEALAVWATRGKHVNVLTHAFGFVNAKLDESEKKELLGLIDDFRRGMVPWVAPVTLLNRHLDRHPVPAWIRSQVYLEPSPEELLFMTHA